MTVSINLSLSRLRFFVMFRQESNKSFSGDGFSAVCRRAKYTRKKDPKQIRQQELHNKYIDTEDIAVS